LKLSRKYSGLLMVIIMTIALDSVMSFTMVSINTGWDARFLQRFVNAWLIGFAVTFPTSLLTFQLAKKLINRIVSE